MGHGGSGSCGLWLGLALGCGRWSSALVSRGTQKIQKWDVRSLSESSKVAMENDPCLRMFNLIRCKTLQHISLILNENPNRSLPTFILAGSPKSISPKHPLHLLSRSLEIRNNIILPARRTHPRS